MGTETAILLISDLHFGKQTPSYDTDVFRKRMRAVARKIANIKAEMTGYEFDKLVVCVLGDVNDGTGIYPNQPNYQDITDPRKQAKELAEFMAGWVRDLKETWGEVQLEMVPGNHGRSGKYVAEAANWDLVCFDYLKAALGNDAEVGYSETGDPFVRQIQIRKHKYLLYHAHEIRMYQNIPWYGAFVRLLRWYSSHLGPFDAAFLGHFHTSGMWRLNKLQAICCGTMVSDDEWALRVLGLEGANRWWLLGCSDKRPITWSFELELT